MAQKCFEAIGFAKVSFSAKQAVSIGYLTKEDKIIVNGDHRVSAARDEVLAMSDGYAAPEMRTDLFLPGKGGRLAVKSTVKGFLKSGKIGKHTSELQSHSDLVCRLLLEKKKHTQKKKTQKKHKKKTNKFPHLYNLNIHIIISST